jgi:pimeloyl-ACP methyl ester carboxylesterase
MGVKTAYRREGDGPQAVYLHGAGLTQRWLPFYGCLAKSLDLTVPEHPGFGDTEWPDKTLDFDDLVIHYDQLFDQLELDQVHLIGHSLGAWIAAEYATYHPKRVRSLSLICPIGLRVPGHPIHDVFRMTPDDAPGVLFNGNLEGVAEFVAEPDSAEQRVHDYQELTAAAQLMWNPRYDRKLDHRLQRVSAKAVVAVPDEDRLAPPEQAERWLELLPNATRVQVSGGAGAATGHLMIVQQPEKLAGAIVGELDGTR